MFISKKHIPRRTILRGMGAAVALPFLEAMVPAQTPLRKSAATPLSRLTCIEMVHGAAGSTEYGTAQHYWAPEKEGSDFEFTLSLKPLEPYRDNVTIISHTDCRQADPKTPNEEDAGHRRSSAVFLTGGHPKYTDGSDVYCATSIEQMYAQKFGQDTPLPSIVLGIEKVDEPYHSISWSSPSTPLPAIIDPRMTFEELFGDGGSAEERKLRRKENHSILDKVSHAAARLRRELGAKDQARLDEYLQNVREIERRIEKIEEYNASAPHRELPQAPLGVPDSWEEHVKLMCDLMVLGFSAEVTRVSSLKLSRDAINRVFPESGVDAQFHPLSHHAEDPTMIEQFARLNQYHIRVISHLLEKMKTTEDGDGNLLEHSLVFYGSPMGNSNNHNHLRVPLFIAGHACDRIKGNQHIRCKDRTPQANVLLTILNKLGLDDETIGDSTGIITI